MIYETRSWRIDRQRKRRVDEKLLFPSELCIPSTMIASIIASPVALAPVFLSFNDCSLDNAFLQSRIPEW